MNRFKIFLVSIVVLSITAGTMFWIQSSKDLPPVKKEVNSFAGKIETEISLIKAKPNNQFCKGVYLNIANQINVWSMPEPPTYPYGRFGKTKLQNDQWKQDLERNLYAAYVDKFVKQAKYVIGGSIWKTEDLSFIQSELHRLKISKLLVSGSPVDKEFNKIQKALNKYNEISSFISTCASYNFDNMALGVSFPLDEAQTRINRASALLASDLENVYTNNCTRLRIGLKEIPAYLFNAHVNYLDRKIDNYSNTWCSYSNQGDYSNRLFRPLNEQIDELKSTLIYDGIDESTRVNEINPLDVKWINDNSKAYKAQYPCRN
jgi:hypothetical protein